MSARNELPDTCNTGRQKPTPIAKPTGQYSGLGRHPSLPREGFQFSHRHGLGLGEFEGFDNCRQASRERARHQQDLTSHRSDSVK